MAYDQKAAQHAVHVGIVRYGKKHFWLKPEPFILFFLLLPFFFSVFFLDP